MTYKEVKADVFDYHDKGYYLIHCISADFKLGAGIAKEFEKRFGLRKGLYSCLGSQWYLNFAEMERGVVLHHPGCKVIDLVTKARYWFKPTLSIMNSALIGLREFCKERGIGKIAMPRIGCGLDGLHWEDVSEMIKYIFKDTDIEIVVCYL